MPEPLENACARLTRTVTAADIEAFAALSGDRNPLHLDAAFARETSFGRPVAHGMLLASYVSTLVGMHLPGAGALWTRQNFEWAAPVFAGDTVELTLRVTHRSAGANVVQVEVNAVNQEGVTVLRGDGTVMMVERRERSPDRELSTRAAFVSGASRGVGAAVAAALAREGVWVGVNYRQNEAAAADVCHEIERCGGRAIPVRADVTDQGSVEQAIQEVSRGFGRPVDILVNNAAFPPHPRPFLALAWDEVRGAADLQVRAAFLCSQAVLPAMLVQKSGRIVNIGSVYTRMPPPPEWTAFVMAKAALAGLTRSLAAEFGPAGVRVNMVSPGLTETPASAVVPERLRKVQAMQTPLRRIADADDVARAVVFLCGPGGEHIAGAEIPVCGGIWM